MRVWSIQIFKILSFIPEKKISDCCVLKMTVSEQTDNFVFLKYYLNYHHFRPYVFWRLISGRFCKMPKMGKLLSLDRIHNYCNLLPPHFYVNCHWFPSIFHLKWLPFFFHVKCKWLVLLHSEYSRIYGILSWILKLFVVVLGNQCR